MGKKPTIILDDNVFCQTTLDNNSTFIMYYKRLMLMAMTMFKWENVPNNIPIRWIERVLAYYGKGAFVNDPELGFMFLPCVPSGELNVYHEPIRYNVYSVNYSKVWDAKDIVVVRNNYLEMPTTFTLSQYAARIANTERTIDVNMNAQKTPVAIFCSEEERLTMLNLYSKYEGNEPFIFGSKNIDLSQLKVLNTSAPYLVDNLNLHKQAVWKEALSYLGLVADVNEKRERLLSKEVEGSTALGDYSANIMLTSRQIGVDEINEKFGLDISVYINNHSEKELEILDNSDDHLFGEHFGDKEGDNG